MSTGRINKLRVQAEAGDAEAQYKLGCAYHVGDGVRQNRSEAVQWWKQAAGQGHAIAQYNLGCAYDSGEGVPQDYKEAVRRWRLAADRRPLYKGYAAAQFKLGVAYEKGKGVPQNDKEAVRWFRLATGDLRPLYKRHAVAQFKLGLAYYKGKGVHRRDVVSAYVMFSFAAARSDSEVARNAKNSRNELTKAMTPEQVAKAKKQLREKIGIAIFYILQLVRLFVSPEDLLIEMEALWDKIRGK